MCWGEPAQESAWVNIHSIMIPSVHVDNNYCSVYTSPATERLRDLRVIDLQTQLCSPSDPDSDCLRSEKHRKAGAKLRTGKAWLRSVLLSKNPVEPYDPVALAFAPANRKLPGCNVGLGLLGSTISAKSKLFLTHPDPDSLNRLNHSALLKVPMGAV